jgi:hypothetical protein
VTEYEVAAENGHRVRVDADDELEAVTKAGEVDPDIWYAGAYPVDGRPVGWDGGDPHDADDEAESRDNGDVR